MTNAERTQKVARLANLSYDGAAIENAIARVIGTIASSGLDGSHAACSRLHRIRRAFRRAVLSMDGAVTEAVRRHEADARR